MFVYSSCLQSISILLPVVLGIYRPSFCSLNSMMSGWPSVESLRDGGPILSLHSPQAYMIICKDSWYAKRVCLTPLQWSRIFVTYNPDCARYYRIIIPWSSHESSHAKVSLEFPGCGGLWRSCWKRRTWNLLDANFSELNQSYPLLIMVNNAHTHIYICIYMISIHFFLWEIPKTNIKKTIGFNTNIAQWLCWIGVAHGAKTKEICLVPWVLGPIGRMALFQLRQENHFPVPNRDPQGKIIYTKLWYITVWWRWLWWRLTVKYVFRALWRGP